MTGNVDTAATCDHRNCATKTLASRGETVSLRCLVTGEDFTTTVASKGRPVPLIDGGKA